MRRVISSVLILLCAAAFDATAQWSFTDARELTVVGKLFPDTPNTWHRVDTDVYEGFDKTEFNQVHMSSGIAVAFRTDSPSISVKPTFIKAGKAGGCNTAIVASGFDLYIRKGGKWLWAGMTTSKEDENRALLYFRDGGMCDCLVYLPLFSELSKVEIGVKEGCRIVPLDKPFKHRIGVFGSSFTQGYGCSRPGMCWTSQFSRQTGLELCNLGCGGHSLLQPYFASALADAPVEAFLFDAMSNPKADVIEERLFSFIETIQAKKPGVPLIFIKTLYREWRNFNGDVEGKEAAKMEMSDFMMKKACKKYNDVYYVKSTNAADPLHETTVDGTHPGDWGYSLYVESVRAEVLKILARYGIK